MSVRTDWASDARKWLEKAEKCYGQTDGDPVDDGMIAAAIGQAYATLQLAEATDRVAMAAEEATS